MQAMGKFRQSIKGVENPGQAMRFDFVEMPTIPPLSSLRGRQTCVDIAEFAADNKAFLRAFMRLEHVPLCQDSFSRLFRHIEPKLFGMARFAKKVSESNGEGRRPADRN